MNGTFDSRLLRRVFVCRTMSRWLDEDSNTSGGFHLNVVVREGPQWFTLATNFIRPASDLSLNFFDKQSLYRISMLGFVIYWYLIDTLLALIKWYLISLLVLIRSGPWRPNLALRAEHKKAEQNEAGKIKGPSLSDQFKVFGQNLHLKIS